MQTRSPRTEPASAVQRAGPGSWSRPMTSTAMPKRIGTQIASEMIMVVVARLEALQLQPEPREDGEHAEDHRERVVVDVAGLHPSRDPGEPADQLRGAVHHDPVDDGAVTPGPEAVAHLARPAGE